MAELPTPPRPESATVLKRGRDTQTGKTPHRPKKRVPLREKEQSMMCEGSGLRLPLFPPASAGTMSLEEVKALVEFTLSR